MQKFEIPKEKVSSAELINIDLSIVVVVVVVYRDPGCIRGNTVTMQWYILLLSASIMDVPTKATLINVQSKSESYHLVH